uniref:Putative glycosyltransferase YkoT n=1 Tax=uncultured Alphaproteobacteria bacterium TaxID=91750 RepID=A0A6G8F3L8_9PROT|nr:putative glycosyltransferase YkoT [uncultured Alphaproteobacteria bacterium]
MKKLLIIVPCYNEEEILPSTITTMSSLLKKMIKDKLAAPNSRVHFVDDGSSDKTWEILGKACARNKLFEASRLSRNFGHQSAILAGMYDNDADVYVTIDADLQDDPNCIIEMMKKIDQGCDIVYGVRNKRNTDSYFKRFTAQGFYKAMSLLGVRIIYNHADFRMMSRRAVNELKQFPERNLFLRAVVPLVGFKSDMVYYDRTARMAGETKYPLKKMLALAWNGISSFSIVPLRLVTFMGFLISLLGAGFVLKILLNYNTHGAVSGWASTVTLITLFSGVQLISLGIIGEYIAKIFVEVKKRPLYIIDEKIKNGQPE